MAIPVESFEVEVALERREKMALKGRRLYEKYCGLDGKGICAESFAEYHISLGELVIARDFLVYLHERLETLRSQNAPANLITMIERLIRQIRGHLGE